MPKTPDALDRAVAHGQIAHHAVGAAQAAVQGGVSTEEVMAIFIAARAQVEVARAQAQQQQAETAGKLN